MSEDSWKIAVKDLPDPGTVVRIGRALFACFEDASDGLSVPNRGSVVAYLNVCTHMGCRLVRSDDPVCLRPGGDSAPCTVLGPCACHGSSFDLDRDGLVVFGPATMSLPRLSVTCSGDQIIASLPDSAHDPLQENWPN